MAIAALILGILSFFCLGPLTGLPAIILGVIALSRAKAHPTEYGSTGVSLAAIITGAVGSLFGLAMAALMVALLVPRLGRAREMANRTADAASLRQLGVAMEIYANENRGRFPPDLAAATVEERSPTDFVSKNSTTTPPTYTMPVTDWTSLVTEINDHTDWIYAAPNLKFTSDPEIIVLYSKDVYHHMGRNVVFSDSHVEFVREADLPRCFDNNNTARERDHLPTIQLDRLATS